MWEVKGKKVALFWEGEQVRLLDKGLILKRLHRLQSENSILFFKSLEEIEREGAFQYAYFCLSKRALLKGTLRLKLKNKGVSESIIEEVLENLSVQGYLEDESLCEKWILKELKKGHGLLYIEESLRRKGIDSFDKQKWKEQEKLSFMEWKNKLLKKKEGDIHKVLISLKRRGFSQIF